MVRRILWLLWGLFASGLLVFSDLWILLVSLCSKYMAEVTPVRSSLWTEVFLSARESWGWDLPCLFVFPVEEMGTSKRHRFRITQLFVYFSGIFFYLYSNKNWTQGLPTRSMSLIWPELRRKTNKKSHFDFSRLSLVNLLRMGGLIAGSHGRVSFS